MSSSSQHQRNLLAAGVGMALDATASSRARRDEERTALPPGLTASSARLRSARPAARPETPTPTAPMPDPAAFRPDPTASASPPTAVTATSFPLRPNSVSMEFSPAASSGSLVRRVVFSDPVAFRFLEDDPAVSVIERRHVLPGYELYLVEQWACSRQTPNLVIVTYTGDTKHSIVVGILGIPVDERDWSDRLRMYFKTTQQYHARPKATIVGELLVTNLSSFPSALTVIAVPEGDILKHRNVFIVNEDLKRLGCSGRSAMTLSDPTPATQAKFLQLYKTSDRIPFFQAVMELIKMCQVALFIFDKLSQVYIDGLLCDMTEAAINDWWTEIGSENFNIEPTDGILGPTTVAALLGTLMGARNRLSYYGAPVSKDVFDIESMERGISAFQKAYKLKRTKRLDRQTLIKLHSVTAKAAAGEGVWGVQKAVKSTVAEIGGKRGEFVMGIVGSRDKANIGDIETLELGKFIGLVHGERAKWLWHGKQPRRTPAQDSQQDDPPQVLLLKKSSIDVGGSIQQPLDGRRAQSLPAEDDLENAAKKGEFQGVDSAATQASAYSNMEGLGDRDAALRKTVFKSMAGKVNDARSGLGRIRDAVGGGFRGHMSRPSRDENNMSSPLSSYSTPGIASLAHSSAVLTSPVAVGRAFTWKNKPAEYLNIFGPERDSTTDEAADNGRILPAVFKASPTTYGEQPYGAENLRSKHKTQDVQAATYRLDGVRRTDGASSSHFVEEEGEREDGGREKTRPRSLVIHLKGRDLPGGFVSALKRRHSVHSTSAAFLHSPFNEARYPSRLSFSAAEDAVLPWDEIGDSASALRSLRASPADGPEAGAELARALHAHLQQLQADLAPWVTAKVGAVEALDGSLAGQQAELEQLRQAARETCEVALQGGGANLLAHERARLAEAVRDVEALAARLEYEVGALAGRAADVEDGVARLEAQVVGVERRTDELRRVLENESWLYWLVRTVTGVGTGPNITRDEPT